MKCTNATKFHRKSGGAQWRDLLFIIHSIKFEWKRYPPLCHPDRSVAQWRDLQFCGPLVEMFFSIPLKNRAPGSEPGVVAPSCGCRMSSCRTIAWYGFCSYREKATGRSGRRNP
jgi:hypothetical protein